MHRFCDLFMYLLRSLGDFRVFSIGQQSRNSTPVTGNSSLYFQDFFQTNTNILKKMNCLLPFQDFNTRQNPNFIVYNERS